MITSKDIDNLAELARLELSSEEKAGFLQDLSNILAYVGEVQKISAADIATTPEAQTVNTMRDDVVTTVTGSYTKALVEVAPEHERDYIKVKKIL